MIALYFPSINNLIGLAAVLVVWTCIIGLGGLILRHSRFVESWLFAGFGMVSMAFTCVGTVTPLPFSLLYAVTLIAGGVGVAIGVRRNVAGLAEIGSAVVLALPVLLLMAGASASQWDEFSNWLPKHRYLFEFDRFPQTGQPASLSALPAYPYGLPLIGYLSAQTAGFFVENAGALFNAMLVVGAGVLIARCAAEGAGREAQSLPWPLLALGLLAATLLNPAFVPKIVFTAYLDWTTAVILAAATVACWRVAEALIGGDAVAARREALVAGFALAGLINLKQANLVLAFLVLGGLATVLLCWSPRLLTGRVWHIAPRLILPALLTYLTWRAHVHLHIGQGEFSFLPLERWLWGSSLDIAARMALIASKKGGYFLLFLTLVAIAIFSLRRPSTPFHRLTIFAAIIFVGYNGFLYVAYVGAFGEGEGRAAASYWRYNTQLGVIGVATAAYGLGVAWRNRISLRIKRHLGGTIAATIVTTLVLVAPLAQAQRIRFDINPAKSYVRSVGSELSSILPDGAHLAVVDRNDNGFWALLIRYEVGRRVTVQSISGVAASDPQAIRARLDGSPAIDFVWVHVPEPPIEAALSQSLAGRQSYLLERVTNEWRILRTWPWPEYDDPHRFND